MPKVTRTLDTKLEVLGEKEYKNALKAINKELSSSYTEMSRVNAMFADNSGSVDAVAARTEILNKQLTLQNEKLKAAQAVLAYANEKYTAGSDEVKKYTDEVIRAETAVLKTEHALKKQAAAMKDAEFESFRGAISEVDQELARLNSELKVVTSAYGNNASSAEALTAKNEKLNEILVAQRKRLNEIYEEGKAAVAIYGENSDQARQLEIDFNNAAAAMHDTENAIESNNTAMEKLDDTSRGIGDVLDELAGKFGVDLPDGMTNALNSMGNFSGRAVILMGGVAAAVMGVVKAEQALMDMTREAAEGAANLLAESSQTGLGTDTLQQLEYASEYLKVPMDTMKDGLKTLTERMASARDGNAELMGSFDALGVSIYGADGQLRDSWSVFQDVTAALGDMQNKTEQDAAAMELLGESAQQLAPIYEDGGAAMRGYAEEAVNLGYVLTNDELKALKEVDTAHQHLIDTQEAMRKQMAAEFAPTATAVYTKFAEVLQKTGNAMVQSGLVDSLGSILSSVIDIATPLIELAQVVLPVVAAALKPVQVALALVADALNIIVGIVTLNGSKIQTALGWGSMASNTQRALYGSDYKTSSWGSSTGNFYNPETGLYEGNYYSANASGNDNFTGGWTLVGERGPELVSLPQGSRIANAQDTRMMMGGDIFNITVDMRSISDLNRFMEMMQQLKVDARMRGRR